MLNFTACEKGDSSITPTLNGHEYVDLGLSVKWATCNVGATSPEEYGNHFAWGEINPKNTYTKTNSKTYGKSMNDIHGNAEYDAASANWGGSWRMPTKSEIYELISKCSWLWTTQNGVKGYKVTSSNGNHIFIPAAGYYLDSSLNRAESFCYYWTSTALYSQYRQYRAYYFHNNNGSPDTNDSYRYYGLSIRPVTK